MMASLTRAPNSTAPPGGRREARVRVRASSQRGFTLLEVMAAVMIVGILAAVALPAMSRQMRGRRANQFAQEINMFYRNARARAIGRGAAHLVRFRTSPLPQGEVLLFEAIQPEGAGANIGNCGPLPPSASNSCLITNWQTGSANARYVDYFGPGKAGTDAFKDVKASFIDSLDAPHATSEMCFSPSGRVYYRDDTNTTFAPLYGVARIEVQQYDAANIAIGIKRVIVLPPNGGARMLL